jgi:hypothetical protein
MNRWNPRSLLLPSSLLAEGLEKSLVVQQREKNE